jgi:hypothetical protein
MSEVVNADGQDTSAEETPNATSMSREELDAVLYGAPEEDSQAGEAEGEGEGEESEESPDEGAEDDSTDDDQGESVDDSQSDDRDDTIAALEARIEQQSKLLDKFGTEVGLLRKTSPEDEKARLDAIREAYLDDPIEGDRLLQEYREEQKTAEKQGRDAELSQIIEKNRSVVTSSIKDFEANLDSNVSEIAEIMEADGASKETISAFKENPYILDGSTLFALHKRNEVLNKVVSLEEQLAERDTKIAELEKKPGEVLDKIANATNLRTLSGREGSSSSAAGGQKAPTSVAGLSRAELKKVINGG